MRRGVAWWWTGVLLMIPGIAAAGEVNLGVRTRLGYDSNVFARGEPNDIDSAVWQTSVWAQVQDELDRHGLARVLLGPAPAVVADPLGDALQPPPRDFSTGDFKFDANGNGTPGEDEDLKLVITNGAGAYGGTPLMTPWGGTLTEEDIDNLVAVIRSLKQ